MTWAHLSNYVITRQFFRVKIFSCLHRLTHTFALFVTALCCVFSGRLTFPLLSTIYLFAWPWFGISFLHFSSLNLLCPSWPASWQKFFCPTFPELSHLYLAVLDPQRFCCLKSQNLDFDTSWLQSYTDQNDNFPLSAIRPLNLVADEWQKA